MFCCVTFRLHIFRLRYRYVRNTLRASIFAKSNTNNIVMGDFNNDLLISNKATHFSKNLIKELSLQVGKHQATHRPPGYIEPLYIESNFEINTALNFLNKNLQYAIDELAPLKTVKTRQSKQPWINSEL